MPGGLLLAYKPVVDAYGGIRRVQRIFLLTAMVGEGDKGGATFCSFVFTVRDAAHYLSEESDNIDIAGTMTLVVSKRAGECLLQKVFGFQGVTVTLSDLP